MIVEKVNILIIDDHPVFRRGMISILENSQIVNKIFESNSLKSALEIIEKESVDLVTLDLNLSGEDGMTFLNKFVERRFKVLVITTFNSSFLVNEVLKKGANGYIKKENLYENLVDSIICVMNGGIYLENHDCDKEEDVTLDKKASKYFALTSAEKEVFRLFAQGKNVKEIATVLGKSYKTVENQKHAVMCKMGIKTDLELFKIAFRLNLTNL